MLSNFTCIDVNSGEPTTQAECGFGQVYTPSDTLHPIPGYNFNISYADGELLNGVMAYENLSIAGIAVSQQEIALVDYAEWFGDGTSSGLIGLAYSSLTNAYTGTNAANDQPGGNVPYSDLFNTMATQNLTAASFSVALNRPGSRSSSGGYLAFGGIPDIKHDPYFVRTPITVMPVEGAYGQSIYTFYSITVQGWAIGPDKTAQFNVTPRSNAIKRPVLDNGTSAIVDSGTTLVYAPDDVVAALAAAFNPPATFSNDYGIYLVNCSAAVPVFGVDISNKIFYINPQDLVVADPSGVCYLGVQSNEGSDMSILGDTWLRNILAVFDVGAGEMRFSAREFTVL